MKLNPRATLGFGLGVFLLATTTLAQPVADREAEVRGFAGAFLFRVWDAAEGLLPTYVRDVAQTPDGYVWLVVNEGLVRFDGLRSVTFSGKNVPSLPTPMRGLRARVDGAGRLWTTTADGRVFSLHQDTWREWGKAEGWLGFAAEAVAVGREEMWFAGGTNLMRLVGERFVSVPLPGSPTPLLSPVRLAVEPGGTHAGTVWFSSRDRVWRRVGETWEAVAGPTELKSAVQGLAAARDGGVWVASLQQVRRFVGKTVARTLVRPVNFRGDVLELLEDSRGFLWAGGAQYGLRIFTPTGEVLNPAADVDSLRPQITSLFEDRERNVLVGTTGAGLARFRPKVFEVSLGEAGGLTGAQVNTLCVAASNVVLVGTEGSGLHRVVAGKSQLITSADGGLTRRHRVTSVLRLRDGTVLAAVASRGLFRVTDYTAQALPTPPPAKELVRVMFEDATGTLWLGCDKGLLARAPGGEFAPVPGVALHGVRNIAEGPDGTLWFAGPQGVAQRRPGLPIALFTPPEMPKGGNVLALATDPDGTLWLAVENRGLLRVRGGQGFLFGLAQGLPAVSFGAIVAHGDNLWLPSERGLLRVARASVDTVASGRASHLEFEVFNRGDGLPSDAFRRALQPTTAVAPDGRLWFATHKGVVALDLTQLATAAYQPPPIIEEVRAEHTRTTITATNRTALHIPAGTRHMTIRCTVPALAKPEQARFSYRLEGLEDYWHDAGSERVIRFYDLPPGNFTFHVRALGTDGRWVSGPASSLGLIVEPHYWQTLWFRVLAGLALAALSGWVVWRAQQTRIAQRDARLREQEARAKLEIELQQAPPGRSHRPPRRRHRPRLQQPPGRHLRQRRTGAHGPPKRQGAQGPARRPAQRRAARPRPRHSNPHLQPPVAQPTHRPRPRPRLPSGRQAPARRHPRHHRPRPRPPRPASARPRRRRTNPTRPHQPRHQRRPSRRRQWRAHPNPRR